MVDDELGEVTNGVDGARLRMRQGFGWQLVLLLTQFLLGMMVNLWVTIPSVHPGAYAANYFVGLLQGIPWALGHSNLFLQLHISIGLALWLMAMMLVIGAVRLHDGASIGVTITGWMGISGAGFNGGSFLNYGHSVSSLLMAVGFALAAACYVWGWGRSLRVASQSGQVSAHG